MSPTAHLNGQLLKVEDLRSAYDGRPILAGVSLRVDRGEIVAVLGGSGCGKTTLLRVIAGLQEAEAGTVELFGQALREIPPEARRPLLARVGVLFQQGALFSSLTVAQNVAMPLRLAGEAGEPEIVETVASLLHDVGLEHAGDLRPAQLSGGMRKRAALARALAARPDLLLCDEPSAGLDPIASAELDELLGRLVATTMGVLLVTHELDSVRRVAGRVVILRAGRVLAAGRLDEVERIADPYLQAFLARRPLDSRPT